MTDEKRSGIRTQMALLSSWEESCFEGRAGSALGAMLGVLGRLRFSWELRETVVCADTTRQGQSVGSYRRSLLWRRVGVYFSGYAHNRTLSPLVEL